MGIFYSRIIIVVPLMLPPKSDLYVMERIMACIPPNPRRVGYIDPIHGPLDGPLYMGSHIRVVWNEAPESAIHSASVPCC